MSAPPERGKNGSADPMSDAFWLAAQDRQVAELEAEVARLRRPESGESLTLDMNARTRAAGVLSAAFEQGHRSHYCSEWNDGDGCTACWEIAADVLRAAEGFQKCSRCNGGGMIAPGDVCRMCGGDGLEPLA